MHAASIHAHDGLGKEAGREAHAGGHLAADQLVELDVIGSRNHFGVAVVDLKLRRRDFRMVLLVLEAHRALHFRCGVDERAQLIARQRVIVAAGVDVLELAGFGIVPLGVHALEEEAFDFVGGVQGVIVLLVLILGELLQYAADVGRVRAAVLIDDFAEHQHLAGPEVIGWSPVEGGPVEADPSNVKLSQLLSRNFLT